jgi:hypothetical protein
MHWRSEQRMQNAVLEVLVDLRQDRHMTFRDHLSPRQRQEQPLTERHPSLILPLHLHFRCSYSDDDAEAEAVASLADSEGGTVLSVVEENSHKVYIDAASVAVAGYS